MRDCKYKAMSYLLYVNIIILGAAGYSADTYLPDEYDFLIWLMCVIIVITISSIRSHTINSLYKKSFNDNLTGLRNRRYFYVEMGHVMGHVKKENEHLSLLMLDLDHFKKFNDTYGHDLGDLMLKETASIINSNIRRNDSAIRWGGEEFIVILPGADTNEAFRIAERIRLAVQEHKYCYEDICCRATISIGVASIENEIDIDQFVKNVDTALYAAKEERNRTATMTIF